MEVLKRIEELLDIKLEEKRYGDSFDPNQKNTYSIRKDYIDDLRLDNVTINDFSKLLPFIEKLSHFDIHDSTIQNFSELLKLNCYHLNLDNVVFKNNSCDTFGKVPGHLIISNTKLNANCFKCFKKTNMVQFRQVEFKNCHIENIQELDNLEPVSLLILDQITFTYEAKKTIKKATRRLSLSNTKFKDLSFLPFKDSLENIELKNCQIGSFAGFIEIPNIKELSIDSDSVVENQTILEGTSSKNIKCIIKQGGELRNVKPLKNYINHLQLDHCREMTFDFIEVFKNVKHLSFYKSKAYLNAFLPIANQIETVYFEESKILNYNSFIQFKKLTNFQSKCYEEDNNGIRTFKKIYPLRNQLKVLNICEFQEIKNPHLIEEFTTLETLKIEDSIPIQTAIHILTLKNLKKLFLSVEEGKHPLNLEKLTALEFLVLEAELNFIGFEHLTKLKSLQLGGDLTNPSIDINVLPKMESLKRLSFISYNYEIRGLEQFPNLEALKIKGSPKIKLGKLEHLKVLCLENSSIKDFSTFQELPNLEKLDLSSFQNKLDITGLNKFPNLKYLTLLETEVNNINHIEPLKNLEYLDLYDTGISDVLVLNTLPNIKEVNLNTGSANKLEKQLDKPEIAFYCGLPSIFLSIWKEEELEIY